MLSLVPHQEPRFLVALVGPMVLALSHAYDSVQTGPQHKGLKRLMSTWLAFNLLAGLVYGVLHQGGVVPAMETVYSDICSSALSPNASSTDWHIVFAHTYMPPHHLLPRRAGSLVPMCFPDDASSHLMLSDLAGAHEHEIAAFLLGLLGNSTRVMLVSSGVSGLPAALQQHHQLTLAPIHSLGPHLCLEKAPLYLQNALNIDSWSVLVTEVFPA